MTTPSLPVAPRRREVPPLRLALGIALAVAVVVGVLAAVRVVRGAAPYVASAFTSPVHHVPGEFSFTAERGGYAIFERTGTESTSGGTTTLTSSPTRLVPGEVEIRAPDGSRVATRQADASFRETIGRNGVVYTASLRFDVRRGGRYDVLVEGPRADVLVSRTMGGVLGAIWPALALGALCAVAAITCLVLLLIGTGRRERG